MSGHGNQDADYLNGRHKEIVCPECGGEGICYRTQALDDCTRCNGTGRVRPTPPVDTRPEQEKKHLSAGEGVGGGDEKKQGGE